jgi:choline-sulfatase
VSPVECEGKMSACLDEPHGPYTHWLDEQGLYETFRNDYLARQEKGWIKDVSHDSVLPAEAHEDMFVGRKAVEWLEQIPGDGFPWHLLVSFVGPHDPFDPPAEYAERYRDAAVPPAITDSFEGKPAWQKTRDMKMSDDQIAHTRRQYCASITAIDEAIGKILAALEATGQADNTYIVFTSDHGEMLGDHGMYTKCAAYESSIRLPLLVAGPGIAPGRRSDALIELIDLNPTVCELARLAPQENLDAKSFAGILRGQAESHRTEIVSEIRNWRCIRTDRYKLVENHNDLIELYDLAEDPNELNNLAPANPEHVRELTGRMHQRYLANRWQR